MHKIFTLYTPLPGRERGPRSCRGPTVGAPASDATTAAGTAKGNVQWLRAPAADSAWTWALAINPRGRSCTSLRTAQSEYSLSCAYIHTQRPPGDGWHALLSSLHPKREKRDSLSVSALSMTHMWGARDSYLT